MGRKDRRVWQGTLALMILKTLETLGRKLRCVWHCAAHRAQTSGDLLSVNYGTLLPRVAQARAGRLRSVAVGRL